MAELPPENQGWSRVSLISILLTRSLRRSSKQTKCYQMKQKLTQNEIFGVFRDVQPNRVVIFNLVENCFSSNFFVISWIEWKMSGEHQVNYDSQAPNINSLIVRLLTQNFRCNIAKSSKWLSASLTRSEGLRKTKVDKLDWRIVTVVHH